jgi:hypothetical protein
MVMDTTALQVLVGCFSLMKVGLARALIYLKLLAGALLSPGLRIAGVAKGRGCCGLLWGMSAKRDCVVDARVTRLALLLAWQHRRGLCGANAEVRSSTKLQRRVARPTMHASKVMQARQ